SGGAADLDAIPADDHVAGGSIGPADQVAARKLKANTGSNGEGVGPRRIGADEVALDEVVRAALEEDTGITAQYDIALAGQRAADPARAKSGIGKHANADWARDQAGGIGADEATFNDDVGRLNQNASAPAVINHQAAKGAADNAREEQARWGTRSDCAADFDQQHGIVAIGQRVGAGTGLRVAVNDDWIGE